MNDLVSIITPCYNSANFIAVAIESVISQTYNNWEMLIVDDCSKDNSAEVIKSYVEKDNRIKYLKTEFPSGSPTRPRNIAIEQAQGRYIAFLDSDDVWLPYKLEEQLALLSNADNVALVYSNYEKINERGERNNRLIIAPDSVTYNDLLYGCVIGCLTAIYDTHKVGKMYMTDNHQEDYILWLSILKKGYIAQNTNSVLALYRISENSLSSNKFKVIGWQWNVYRNVEKLGLIQSVRCFISYAIKGFIKAVK